MHALIRRRLFGTPRHRRPNKVLLMVLPVLQKEEEPVGTTELARLAGCSRDAAHLALLRIYDEGMLDHSWGDEGLQKKTGGREGRWLLSSMERTLERVGEA